MSFELENYMQERSEQRVADPGVLVPIRIRKKYGSDFKADHPDQKFFLKLAFLAVFIDPMKN